VLGSLRGKKSRKILRNANLEIFKHRTGLWYERCQANARCEARLPDYSTVLHVEPHNPVSRDKREPVVHMKR
jgi:hypothetical protein